MKQHSISRWLCNFSFLLFTITIITLGSDYSVAYATNTGHVSTDEEKQEVKLNVKSTTIVKGKTYTIKVYNLTSSQKVTFKSSDSDIASVDSNGVITANKVGSTTITAVVKEGSKSTSLTCNVTVGPTALSVKFTKNRIILGLDKSDLLNVILKPSNTAEAARFSSLDTSIASVSVRGRVNAKAIGMTYIFAEIGDIKDDSYKYSTCTVIVVKPEDVSTVDEFFQEHPELNKLTNAELSKALEVFFKAYAKSEQPTNFKVKQISEDSKEEEPTYKYDTDESLKKNLETYLDDVFNLSKLAKELEKETEK